MSICQLEESLGVCIRTLYFTFGIHGMEALRSGSALKHKHLLFAKYFPILPTVPREYIFV